MWHQERQAGQWGVHIHTMIKNFSGTGLRPWLEPPERPGLQSHCVPARGCTCPGEVYLLGGYLSRYSPLWTEPAWRCTCSGGLYLPGGCTCPGRYTCLWGIPARGCTCLGVYLPGGLPARGLYLPRVVYLPEGVPAQRRCTCWGGTCPGTPTCEQNDKQVQKYYLPPNFVCGRY